MRSKTSLQTSSCQAAFAALALVSLAGGAAAQQPGAGAGDVPGHSAFHPGASLLYADDWSTTDIGDIPETLKLAGGTSEVVEERGKRFLRISESASFDLVLSGLLPESYTIDFDMQVPSSTGYSVEIRPDLPGSRPGTAGLGRRAEHPVVHCGAIGSGVYGDGPNTTKRFDDRFARAMVPCEIIVSPKGVKVYFAGQLAANVPGADLGRTNRIRIHVPAGQGQEALISSIRVATDVGADVTANGVVAPIASDQPELRPPTDTVEAWPDSAPASPGVVAPIASDQPEPRPPTDTVEAWPDSAPASPLPDGPTSNPAMESPAPARANTPAGSSLRELPDRVKRRAEARAAERLDSAANKIERKIGEGTEKALDAADTVTAKALRATDRVIDCLVSDLSCIRRARRAGAKVAVTDANGQPVSSADSAGAVAGAGAATPPPSSRPQH